MKSIFLSVVIISALVISGLGGTLATWSDSETSWDNYITTGSVDLLVNGADDEPYGEGVPAKVTITDMIPCNWYGPYQVDLWNAGQHDGVVATFIHLKNLVCSNIAPREGSGYPDYNITSGPWKKPEPELVAEYGGWVNSNYVTGVGRTGDECSMATHVRVAITNDTNAPGTGGYDPVNVETTADWLDKYSCNEIYLFDLEEDETRTIYLWFKLIQESEEDYGYDYIDDPPWWTGDDNDPEFGWDDPDFDQKLLHWYKFNDWPSWALMKDKVRFDLEFDVSLFNHAELPPPPPSVD
jgi:predicted ribosomally synthesized peptide with SipW-like signal peptide